MIGLGGLLLVVPHLCYPNFSFMCGVAKTYIGNIGQCPNT